VKTVLCSWESPFAGCLAGAPGGDYLSRAIVDCRGAPSADIAFMGLTSCRRVTIAKTLARRRQERHPSVLEREEISRGMPGTTRTIADQLGRSATVSFEIAPNGGRAAYRSQNADQCLAASTSTKAEAPRTGTAGLS
jgi:hypothetical protein